MVGVGVDLVVEQEDEKVVVPLVWLVVGPEDEREAVWSASVGRVLEVAAMEVLAQAVLG